jgi:hypothetical protein
MEIEIDEEKVDEAVLALLYLFAKYFTKSTQDPS